MNSADDISTIRKPVIHHVHELQWRLIWSVVAIVVGATAAYMAHTWLLSAIQRPLGQTLYYTSPMGGFNFLLKLCLVVGFVGALPVILYQIFSFLGPLLTRRHRLTITLYTFWSFALACLGIAFAYFISLPSALHFLSQFGGSDIKSLITVDEYFNFALAYLAGFALMFQVPLIILFINRINRLKPGQMMRAQRYIILFSFIAAAILTPTPDPVNQTIMALPAILLYQLGIVLVWSVNRRHNRKTSKVMPVTTAVERVLADRSIDQPRAIDTTEKVLAYAPSVAVPQPAPASQRTARRVYQRSTDGFVVGRIERPVAPAPPKPAQGPSDVISTTPTIAKRYFDIMAPAGHRTVRGEVYEAAP